MLEYDRINISTGIVVNETKESGASFSSVITFLK